MTDGILVHQQIRALIDSGALTSTPAIAPTQIQPASLDLRLSTRGYRVRSGFLPENCRVADRLGPSADPLHRLVAARRRGGGRRADPAVEAAAFAARREEQLVQQAVRAVAALDRRIAVSGVVVAAAHAVDEAGV